MKARGKVRQQRPILVEFGRSRPARLLNGKDSGLQHQLLVLDPNGPIALGEERDVDRFGHASFLPRLVVSGGPGLRAVQRAISRRIIGLIGG